MLIDYAYTEQKVKVLPDSVLAQLEIQRKACRVPPFKCLSYLQHAKFQTLVVFR